MPCKAQAPCSFGYFRGKRRAVVRFSVGVSNVHPWMRLSSREEGSGGLTERGLCHTATLSHLPRKQASPQSTSTSPPPAHLHLHLAYTGSPGHFYWTNFAHLPTYSILAKHLYLPNFLVAHQPTCKITCPPDHLTTCPPDHLKTCPVSTFCFLAFYAIHLFMPTFMSPISVLSS